MNCLMEVTAIRLYQLEETIESSVPFSDVNIIIFTYTTIRVAQL